MKKYYQLVLTFDNNIDEEKVFEISFFNNIKYSIFYDIERGKNCFFIYSENKDKLSDILSKFEKIIDIKEQKIEPIYEKFYLKRYLKNYKPFKVGEFNIIPYFHKQKKYKKGINIILNPGYSFGTGEHPTTKLVLLLMKFVEFQNKTVLDCGIGSGILAIAASKKKAKKIFGFDIDESTKVSTKENFKLNKVKNVKYKFGDINVLNKNTKYDIILINMLSKEFKTFFSKIKKILEKNGKIIISGILYEESNTIEKYFEQNGYKILLKKVLGEWVGYILSF
ncbi:MAG: 50S ribosomal protein L11 methyltransferase [candidate division WOR-3 bacterium]